MIVIEMERSEDKRDETVKLDETVKVTVVKSSATRLSRTASRGQLGAQPVYSNRPAVCRSLTASTVRRQSHA